MTADNESLARSYISPEQYEQLLKPVNESRVMFLGKTKHMESYDIRAHLNRVFGFGRWSAEVVSMDLIKEWTGKNSNNADAVYVGYRAAVRLTVCAPDGTQLAVYTEHAAGDALGFPIAKVIAAHDFAMKTAESQALKRAAINLGDQFGLSLYNAGSIAPLVLGTKVPVLGAESEEPADFEELPELLPEDTGEYHDADSEAEPQDIKPIKDVDPSVNAAFEERLQQVQDNVNGLNALRKWAHNAGLPAAQIDRIKARLAELGQ